jgi:hypothetical protein
MPRHDLSGQRFGAWSIVRYATTRSYAGRGAIAYWLCRCDCGTERQVNGSSLRKGQSASCGCVAFKAQSKKLLLHGYARTDKRSGDRTYTTWRSMKYRCSSSHATQYPRYGGRGISVCERWQSFANFLADMGERPAGRTIDRINPSGNYEPSNCRWATPKEQRASQVRPEHHKRRINP